MAKRRVKKRTHVGAKGAAPVLGNAPKKPGDRSPKSMVIRIGASEVGPSVSQLVQDVRKMMEPETATRLKERRANKLRDYTTMAGPLGVTHLLLFSRSSGGNTNLRLAVTPRGPTLHFRVQRYSLCKDVHRSQKRPRSGGGNEFLAPPLLVMNNFSSREREQAQTNGEKQREQVPKHLESLTTTIFQSLFPPINPTATPLKSIKRVLLVDRAPQDHSSDSPNYVLNLRHYAISTRTAKSVPKPLRRLDAAEKPPHHPNQQKRQRNALPDLGRLEDVADYLLDPSAADGFTSGSESEPDTDAEVEVLATAAQKVPDRRDNSKPRGKDAPSGRHERVEKRAIKLHELGPRLQLRLTKVEEGLCGGRVMWHEYIHKSAEEVASMEKAHEARRQEKERRRAEQRANVERKRAERKANGEEVEGEEDEEMDDEEDEWDDDEMDEDGDGDVETGAQAEGNESMQNGEDEDED